MNNLNLIITEQAYNDINLIVDYIAKDNNKVAKKFLEFLIKSCRTLTKFPNLGKKRPDFSYKNTLFYIIKKRYIIAYKTQQENLYILRVLSSYQDICKLI